VRREAAAEVAAALDRGVAELNAACTAIEPLAPADAQALWRLHVAGVLGALVTHVLAPIWREHPEFAPPEATSLEHDFSLPPEAVLRCRAAASELRNAISRLRTQLGAELGGGVNEVEHRLRELEEYLDRATGAVGSRITSTGAP
jgi:hypothetical protein